MTDEELDKIAEAEAIRMLSPVMTIVCEELYRRGFARGVRMLVEFPPDDPADFLPAPDPET